MGTRGFMGFTGKGKTVIAYNHFDSYPGGLGLAMLEWALNVNADDATRVAARVAAMRIVSDETDAPTREDVERLAPYTDLAVNRSFDGDTVPNWYQLLRGTQGDPHATLAAGVYEDASGFPGDSLFCEWGYLVDFDLGVFEAYQGFQKKPHDKGRFASMPPRDSFSGPYYPVALMASWPLGKLPHGNDFLDALREGDEDE